MADRSSAYFDLSHTIEHGMVSYPGLPGPLICDYLSREESRSHYEPGTEFHIGRIDMVANTGTYVDSPFHRYEDGVDLAGLPLSSLADLEVVAVRATAGGNGRAIDASAFESLDVAGKAVLVHTGWDVHWQTERYLSGHPYLTGDAAMLLRDRGARLVGIDSLNIDCTDGGTRPVHSTLLRHDIPIVEHMTGLDRLPDAAGLRFFAVPAKVKSFGTFPVRAFCLHRP